MTQDNRQPLAWVAAGTAAAAFGYLLHRLNRLETKLARHDEDVYWRSVYETRQIQAWTWLARTLDLDAPLPPMRGWAISPDFAVYYVELIRQHNPKNILELGGGVSTILSGAALQQMGSDGVVTAVEALAYFADATADALDAHHVDNANVVHAPLTQTRLGRQRWPWYDLQAIPQNGPIDFLLIDGPAQFRVQRQMVRYPALPVLYDRLVPGALILVDDAKRSDEQQLIARWQQEFPALEVLADQTDFEKGAVLLRKNSTPIT